MLIKVIKVAQLEISHISHDLHQLNETWNLQTGFQISFFGLLNGFFFRRRLFLNSGPLSGHPQTSWPSDNGRLSKPHKLQKSTKRIDKSHQLIVGVLDFFWHPSPGFFWTSGPFNWWGTIVMYWR
jgi:hypothetical protein